MRREQDRIVERTIRMAQFVRSFHLGGGEVQVVELLRGLPRHYDVKVAVTHDAGHLMEQVWALGHMPKEFSFHGTVKQPNTLWQIARLAKWLREQRVELVHAHDFYATLLAVPAAKLARVKVVVGRLDLAHFQNRSQRAALIACSKHADHVVANAEAIRTMLVDEERIPAERVSVIHNGLDVARFDRRQKEGLESPIPDVQGAPVVTHVANMAHPVKRQEDLLQALAKLKQSGQTLHAFLVGDGPRRPEMERLAGELGIADRVHFLGHRKDVPAILAHATMGVLCSSAEGLSNSVMEGLAAGLPMVVTRVGGNPDLIVDGKRGFVVPPFEPDALASAFQSVMENPERAKRMGEAGRAFVQRELTLTKLCERHDALYRAVLDGKRQTVAASGRPRRPLPSPT